MFYFHSIAPLLEARKPPGAPLVVASDAPQHLVHGKHGFWFSCRRLLAAPGAFCRVGARSSSSDPWTSWHSNGWCLAGGSLTQAATPSNSRHSTRTRTSADSTRLTPCVPKNESDLFLLSARGHAAQIQRRGLMFPSGRVASHSLVLHKPCQSSGWRSSQGGSSPKMGARLAGCVV
jgi:hypothetical protein